MKRVLWFTLGVLSVIGTAFVSVQMDEVRAARSRRSPHWDWPPTPDEKQTSTAPPPDEKQTSATAPPDEKQTSATPPPDAENSVTIEMGEATREEPTTTDGESVSGISKSLPEAENSKPEDQDSNKDESSAQSTKNENND